MNDRKKILIFTIAGGVLILGALGYLSWSDWDEKNTVEQESRDLEAKIARAEAEIAKVAAVENRVLILRNSLKSQVGILPDTTKIHGFVDKLTEFAKAAGVSIESLDDSSARRLRTSRKKAKEAFERVTYKLSIRGDMDRLLRFFDMFENKYERFVRIPDFKVSRDSMMTQHSTAQARELPLVVSMKLETYVYNPKAKGYEQVPIRQEAAKIERLRRQGDLDRGSSEMEVAVYAFTPKPDRRDPFVDPRSAGSDVIGITVEERQKQLEVLESFKGRLVEINESIVKESQIENSVERFQARAQTDIHIQRLGEEILKRAKGKFFSVKEYAEEFHEDVELPYEHLRGTRNLGPMVVSPEDVRATVSKMEQALKDGNYEQVIALHGQLEEMQQVETSNAVLIAMFREADVIRGRALAHREFQGMELTLGGCICYGNDPSRAVVIINDRSFSPGETVQSGLVVKSVSSTSVVFDFRGVTVEKRYDENGTN